MVENVGADVKHRYSFTLYAHSADQAIERVMAAGRAYWGDRPFAWSATSSPVLVSNADGHGFVYEVDATTWEDPA